MKALSGLDTNSQRTHLNMEKSNSYVYFALEGDDFETVNVTDRMGIEPTYSWRKGDQGTYSQK